MSITKIALAIPLVLGIACSHSRSQSKSHTGAMWTEHGDGSTQPEAQPQASSGAQTDGSSSAGTASASSESAGDAGTVALTAGGSSSGSSDQGTMGSGGSSESMGTANPSGSSGSSDQGSTATGSSGQGTGTAAGAASGEMVKGKVTKVSSSEISITPKSGTAKTLKIGDDTHVMINGKEAKPSQLKQGQWVQAAYDNDMMATKIVVSSSKQGHKGSSGSHHGTGTSGSSGSGSSGMGGSSGSGSSGSGSGSSGTGGSSGGTQ